MGEDDWSIYGSPFLAAKLSRRTFIKAGTAAATAVATGGLTWVERAFAQTKGTLNLFTWEGYAPAPLVKKFETETGYKVNVGFYPSNGELIAKLKAAKATGFDLVQPSVTLIPAAMDSDLYQPIDPARIPNFKNVIPSMVEASGQLGGMIKGKRYGLPFDWGTEGVSYNTKKITARPTSFGDIHKVTGRLANGEGTLGKLLVDDSMYADLRDTVTGLNVTAQNFAEVSEQVKRGEGTLGRLVSDDSLYNQAEGALRSVSRASQGIEDQAPISVLGTLIGTLF